MHILGVHLLKRLLSLAVLAFVSCGAVGLVGGRSGVTPTPATANIPVASLANGSYAANNWTGFTTNATTVSTTSGRKYIQTTTSSASNTLAIGTADWRDEEVTFYFTFGRAIVRSTGQGGTGLQMSLGISGGGLRISILSGIDYTSPEAGTTSLIYAQSNPSGCITNWPTSADSAFTFGMRGFEAYLLIDGQPAYDTCQTTAMNPLGEIRFYEYRAAVQNAGKVSVWAHSGSTGGGVGNQITATYYALTSLYSNVATNTFDIRDFGVRQISAVTGSMSANSCTLTLNSPRDFRVRDQIIVETGGESGAGAINTIGVGGSSPELHYATNAARDADTSQAVNTYAYIDTDGTTKYWNGSIWTQEVSGMATYYSKWKAPVALIASVIAVDASPATTLTLQTFGANAYPGRNCSAVATTNANVWLDSRIGFYPVTTSSAENFSSAAYDQSTYTGMTFNIAAGTWYMSEGAYVNANTTNLRQNLTVQGAGVASTTIKNPAGVSAKQVNILGVNNGVTIQDFLSIGNLSNVGGTLWSYATTNKNFNDRAKGGPVNVHMEGGNNLNPTVQRIKCIDVVRGCAVISGGNAQILNSEVVTTVGQYSYFQWMFALTNCSSSGQINGITATGAYLLKTAEVFGCDSGIITNVTGTNALISSNCSSSSVISNITSTITTNSFFDITSGWLDEPIININVNAGCGTTTGGTVSNFRLIQSGYVQTTTNSSLKGIQIQATASNWTVSGGYPGGGGCTSALAGFNQAPNFDSTDTIYYGAMAVMSDGPSTTVTGIRSKGTAIGSPGHSLHYGNISLNGANSVATNNVADVIHMGGSSPTTSGNQTNAAYGGC